MLELATLAGIALKTSLLIVAIGVLSGAFARKSAAFRHLLWTSALALSLLMPLAVLYLPSYALISLPAEISRWLVQDTDLEGPSRAVNAAQVLASTGSAPAAGWSLIMTLWILGALILLTREALANAGLICWMRQARPLRSRRWTATLNRVSSEHGLDRMLRVLESAETGSPCTWGFMRPVLLLPAAGENWPESLRRKALLHELTHIRRRDALTTFVSRIACALHWYNPLIWFAAARSRCLQEQACDDAVLRAGEIPSEYAQFLLDAVKQASALRSPGRLAMSMAHRSILRGRIVAILDPHRPRSQPQRLAVWGACASLLGLMLFLATAGVATEVGERVRNEAPSMTRVVRSALPALPALPALAELPALPALPRVPEPPAPPNHPESPAPVTPPTPVQSLRQPH